MIRRIKKHLASPGTVLALIALIVAVSGSAIAIAQQGKKQTLRTRIGGATQQVVQPVTLLPQNTNDGISVHTVTCPSNPKLGPGVALAGGVIDPLFPPGAGPNGLQALEEKTDGPAPGNTNGWLFQFDNDTNAAVPVQLNVLCTFGKLNTKRG